MKQGQKMMGEEKDHMRQRKDKGQGQMNIPPPPPPPPPLEPGREY